MKLAYRVFCDDQNRTSRNDSGASSSRVGGEAENMWSLIWNMEGPSRLKHFLWRIAYNSLALRSNLTHRGIRVDDRCVMCNRAGEEVGICFSSASK